MLLGGDERGRTQGGNNNAWCQDNEISWFDWELDDGAGELLDFTRRLLELRRAHPVFRRTRLPRRRARRGDAPRRVVVPAGRAADGAARLAGPARRASSACS